MRNPLPLKVEEGRIAGPPDSCHGAFIVQVGNARLRVIASDGLGWDHVSVSLATRCPTWDEMCAVKSLFFDDEEVVMQLHPAKSQYVNLHPFCLHLWRPQTACEAEQLAELAPPPIPPPPIEAV